MITLIVWAVVVIVILWLVLAYNGLVRTRTQAQEAWSDIDVQLKRRYDLIPNLVSTVQGYAAHEKSVFEDVTKARATAMQTGGGASGPTAAKADAENQLSGALKSLFAVAENYPDLKANQNFTQLQGRVSYLESQIADRREFYNDSVNIYNIRINEIPDLFVARQLNMQSRELFKVTEEDKQDVDIKFDLPK